VSDQKIAKVWIEPGCIVCKACEVQCAEVFDVLEDGCVVRSKKFEGLEHRIRKAAAVCPVQVIAFATAKRPSGKK
jgi:ferredoxin